MKRGRVRKENKNSQVVDGKFIEMNLANIQVISVHQRAVCK
jgi:hypothetical protein